jgi:hypothetical protein
MVGLLTSMPDAIVTKTYAPILGTGYFSARSVVGRSDSGVSALHDVAEVMHSVSERSTPAPSHSPSGSCVTSPSIEYAAPCRYAAIVMSRWSPIERSDLRNRLGGEWAKAAAEWSSRLFTGSRCTGPSAARTDW